MSDAELPGPCACTTVRRAARALTRTYDSVFAPHGMNATQYAVLRAILRHPGEPIVRVADDLVMDRTSLYRALTPLRGRGWVRERAGRDSRSSTVMVTRSGRRAVERAYPDWLELQRAIVRKFGAARWSALAQELRDLAGAVPELLPGGNA